MAIGEDPREGSVQKVAGFPWSVVQASDATYKYIALAMPGTPTSQAKWQAIRITKASGRIQHAGGTDNFVSIATNIAGLSYS